MAFISKEKWRIFLLPHVLYFHRVFDEFFDKFFDYFLTLFFTYLKENLSWPSFRRRNGEFFGLPPLWHFHRVLAGREHNNEDACKLIQRGLNSSLWLISVRLWNFKDGGS